MTRHTAETEIEHITKPEDLEKFPEIPDHMIINNQFKNGAKFWAFVDNPNSNSKNIIQVIKIRNHKLDVILTDILCESETGRRYLVDKTEFSKFKFVLSFRSFMSNKKKIFVDKLQDIAWRIVKWTNKF